MFLCPNPKEGLPSVLVIVGPTASGKSSLAVQMAKKYNGEIEWIFNEEQMVFQVIIIFP